METRFNGQDDVDLEQKIWAWTAANPNIKVTKRHAVETLLLKFSAPHTGKLVAGESVSVKVEYEEK